LFRTGATASVCGGVKRGRRFAFIQHRIDGETYAQVAVNPAGDLTEVDIDLRTNEMRGLGDRMAVDGMLALKLLPRWGGRLRLTPASDPRHPLIQIPNRSDITVRTEIGAHLPHPLQYAVRPELRPDVEGFGSEPDRLLHLSCGQVAHG